MYDELLTVLGHPYLKGTRLDTITVGATRNYFYSKFPDSEKSSGCDKKILPLNSKELMLL